MKNPICYNNKNNVACIDCYKNNKNCECKKYRRQKSCLVCHKGKVIKKLRYNECDNCGTLS